MTRNIAASLILYGAVIAGLGFGIHRLGPEAGSASLIAGLAGGAVCAVWGALGLGKTLGKTKPLLTLIPIAFVFLSQAVTAWLGEENAGGSPLAALLMTLGLVVSMGMIMRIAYSEAPTPGASPSPRPSHVQAVVRH